MKKFSTLSDDIQNPDLEINIETIKSGEYYIDSIIDIIPDVVSEFESEEVITESGLVAMDADFTNKPVKRGDTVYITALIKKKGASMSSPASQSVIKLRVVDIYPGLSKLNSVLKDK